MRTFLTLFLLLSPQSPYPVTTGKAYKFEKIAEGVYYATGTGSMVTGSNNVLIVGDLDVLVVDTGTSPAAARAFIRQSRHHRARLCEAGDSDTRRPSSRTVQDFAARERAEPYR